MKTKYYYLYIDKNTNKICGYKIYEVDKTQEEMATAVKEFNDKIKNQEVSVNLHLKIVDKRFCEFMEFVNSNIKTSEYSFSEIKEDMEDMENNFFELKYKIESFIESVKNKEGSL